MVGPLLNDLCTILLCFCLHNYALSTDIKKAFLHVRLHEADRDFTHFLWPLQPENSPDNNFQVFRFTSVPFGTASSPFMLHATIDYIYAGTSHLSQKILQETSMLITSYQDWTLKPSLYSIILKQETL